MLLNPTGFDYTYPLDIYNNYWKKDGDQKEIQKLTQSTSSDAYNAFNKMKAKNTGQFTDASYIRLKTVSLSYNLPAKLIKPAKISGINIFMNCQNLLTITGYKGVDPEAQSLYILPVLRSFVFGLNVTL